MGHALLTLPARSPRQLLHRLHGWLGVYLFSLLAVVFLSGTLAVFGHEIDWLLNPDIRADTADRAELDWGGIQSAVQRAYPDASVDWLIAPVGSGFAAQVWITTRAGQARRVYVHPESLVVQGDTSFFNAQRFLRSWHYSFFTNNVIVLVFIASLGFVMLFSLVSGLVIYRRFWRGFLKRPRAEKARVFWGDVHRLLGIWLIPFTALIAVTSIWYFVEVVGAWAGIEQRLDTPPPTVVAQAAPCPAVDAGAAAARARAAFPGLVVTDIILPYTAGEPVEVRGDATAILTRSRGNTVHLDPCGLRVVQVQDASELGAVQRFGHMADPLHFGDFGGLWSKAAWFVFGLLLTGSLVSGATVWWKRLHKRPEERANWPRIAWGSLAVIVGFCAWFGFQEITGYLEVEPAASEQA